MKKSFELTISLENRTTWLFGIGFGGKETNGNSNLVLKNGSPGIQLQHYAKLNDQITNVNNPQTQQKYNKEKAWIFDVTTEYIKYI